MEITETNNGIELEKQVQFGFDRIYLNQDDIEDLIKHFKKSGLIEE